MEVPSAVPVREPEPKPQEDKIQRDFVVPDRRALKEQIQAIDSWLEDDFSAREQLSSQRTAAVASTLLHPAASASAPVTDFREVTAGSGLGGGEEAEILRKLEDVKRRKALGEKPSSVLLRDLAARVKPLLPGMDIERLVHTLRLFTSARYEDHDLYLRILGEIPVQVRGISEEKLTTCVRVLRRLRLPEETYLELFSMEAMNMIRAKRRPQARAPRRPPVVAPRATQEASAASGGLTPKPPSTPPPEAPIPFSTTELVHMGNALTMLGAKHPVRFMDVYQEQLGLAIPKMTQQECELVSPNLATSQLMPDSLRRAFLERCAKVDAGQALTVEDGQAAPDIAQYQREADLRRRRVKHHRNIYIFEASVRKETFSFFSSLPPEIRSYLDRLHEAADRLPRENPTPLAVQVAAVLDQLGVGAETGRSAGPLGLHVVAKATNPRADVKDIVYECNDTQAFYAVRQDDKGASPQLTASTKLRHRLLQRLGVQLVHINIWEWQHMGEAQRVNYMVKLQSL